MTCAICGKTCAVVKHEFAIGVYHTRKTDDGAVWGRAPEETRTIYAPTYFKATADGRYCEAPFCGPRCATAYFSTPLTDSPQEAG